MKNSETCLDEFKVDLRKIHQNRKPGVSGMMRVKNDAEFLEASVISCLPALDELIIVYNDCSDDSPEIIKRMANKYPDKIKTYEYLPKIKAWNLSEEEADEILSGKIPAENTLAGYYNYALSKTTREFVMKIDADQIYFTDKLKEICDAYRSKRFNKKYLYKYLFPIRTILSFGSRIGFQFNFLGSKKIYSEYYNELILFISHKKVNISLSGLNIVCSKGKIFVSLGKVTQSDLNILPPFNGEGDHPIFKVTDETYFKPIVNAKYNTLNNIGISVIETLCGLGYLWVAGPCWLHLNACRTKNIESIQDNIRKFGDSFVEIQEFIQSRFTKISSHIETKLINKSRKAIYIFLHSGLTKRDIIESLKLCNLKSQ